LITASAVAFAKDREHKVFGAEIVVLVTLGFLPREDDDFPASIGESLEHSGLLRINPAAENLAGRFVFILTVRQPHVKQRADFRPKIHSISG
jgi:hypothetical protein